MIIQAAFLRSVDDAEPRIMNIRVPNSSTLPHRVRVRETLDGTGLVGAETFTLQRIKLADGREVFAYVLAEVTFE